MEYARGGRERWWRNTPPDQLEGVRQLLRLDDLVTSSRQQTERWVDEYLEPRYPELVEPFWAALHAYEQIISDGHVRKDLLDLIVSAASSPRRPLADSVIGDLMDLTAKFPEARDSVVGMASSPEKHVRFNALRCIDKNAPGSFTRRLLKNGLVDSSKHVRLLAGYRTSSLRQIQLIPDLERAVQSEGDPKTKSELRHNLRILRDGYSFKRLPAGKLYLWIACADGVHGNALSLRNIPRIYKQFRERIKANITAEELG